MRNLVRKRYHWSRRKTTRKVAYHVFGDCRCGRRIQHLFWHDRIALIALVVDALATYHNNMIYSFDAGRCFQLSKCTVHTYFCVELIHVWIPFFVCPASDCHSRVTSHVRSRPVLIRLPTSNFQWKYKIYLWRASTEILITPSSVCVSSRLWVVSIDEP